MKVKINVLSEPEIERIKSATEDLLETTGFCVTHPEILKKAKAAGALVDEQAGRVRLPAELLRELLAQSPATYPIEFRDGTRCFVGGDQRIGLAITNDPWIIDYETRQPRRPCLDDVRTHAIIAQQLNCVHIATCMDFPVTDDKGPASSLRALETLLLNFGKHYYVYPTSIETLRSWLEIEEIWTEGRDCKNAHVASVAVGVVSPLTLLDDNAEILLLACANDYAIGYTICPMAGSTSPYSIAGTLLQSNAETVVFAALAQIIKPGTPVGIGFGGSVIDMATGRDLYYTLDKVLWKKAGVELGKSYGLPTGAEIGGSMTHRYDQQSGAEGMLLAYSAIAADASVIGGFGSVYNGLGMSAEMMIIQSEYVRIAEYICKGIRVDDESLGLENIKAVGPGGNFLTDELSIKNLRNEEFLSSGILDYSGELNTNSKSFQENAHDKVEELVNNFESPVPHTVQENLRKYFHDEYRRSRQKGK